MAQYFGSVQGARGEASRLGGKESGLTTTAASWSGGIRTRLYTKDGEDHAHVEMIPWHGRGISRTLYCGPVNAPEAKRK